MFTHERNIDGKIYVMAQIAVMPYEVKQAKRAYKEEGYSVRVFTRYRSQEGIGRDYPIYIYKERME